MLGDEPAPVYYTVTRDGATGDLKFHSDEETDPETYEYEFYVVE